MASSALDEELRALDFSFLRCICESAIFVLLPEFELGFRQAHRLAMGILEDRLRLGRQWVVSVLFCPILMGVDRLKTRRLLRAGARQDRACRVNLPVLEAARRLAELDLIAGDQERSKSCWTSASLLKDVGSPALKNAPATMMFAEKTGGEVCLGISFDSKATRCRRKLKLRCRKKGSVATAATES